MHPALEHQAHRPWRIPACEWTWRQQWRDLLFAHWEVPVAEVRKWVPEPLQIDTFDGKTYIALVPFRMTGVMKRPFPDVPYVSAFTEMNVRVYVTYQNKPGVWFLSLDADNHLAVWAARRFFDLPYYYAEMGVRHLDQRIAYRSTRRERGHAFVGEYGPCSDVFLAQKGTLEHWLTERYCLYAERKDGSQWRTEVHHAPWPLQTGTLEMETQSMFRDYGLQDMGKAPLLHFARFIDVVVWDPERID